jgi:hypothetical protein
MATLEIWVRTSLLNPDLILHLYFLTSNVHSYVLKMMLQPQFLLIIDYHLNPEGDLHPTVELSVSNLLLTDSLQRGSTSSDHLVTALFFIYFTLSSLSMTSVKFSSNIFLACSSFSTSSMRSPHPSMPVRVPADLISHVVHDGD